MSTHLGRNLLTAGQSAAHRQLLRFSAGGVMLGLEIPGIQEILKYRKPTAVPRAPAHIAGVINLRGGVVPVIDLAQKLGLAASVPGKRACIVVTESPHAARNYLLGIFVECVYDVLTVDDSAMEPPSPFGGRIDCRFIKGLIRRKDGYVGVLETTQVLGMPALADKQANAGA